MRPERAGDAAAVHAIHEAAFGQSGEAILVARLRAEAVPGIALVAEQAGRAIGHVRFTPVVVEGVRLGSPAGALGPVGVLPKAQGRGAGSALIRAGIEASRALDWRLLFVLGSPTYYARFGFALAAAHGLHYASHAFDAAFQVRELVAGSLSGVSGWVRYHAAFDAVG